MTKPLLQIGDKLRDNDPRMWHRSLLTVVEVLPNGARARDSSGREFVYLRHRIFTDGKARRYGLNVVKD